MSGITDGKVRFGILGYARIARTQVIPAMLQAKNAAPTALASMREEGRAEAKEKFGIEKVYAEYDALLSDPDVDAVYIPLPNHLHREWTLRAARAGKHVLCEKPMGLTRAECEEMAWECEKSGVLLMEAFMYRFTTRTRAILELLASGVIGEVRRTSSSFRFVLDRPGDVRLSPEMGGGGFYDVGCYPVNFAGLVMGEEPVSVAALKTMRDGVDVGLSALLKYHGGAICALDGGFDAQSSQVSEVCGTKGSLLIRDTFSDTATPILLTQGGVTREIPVEPCSRYVLQLEDFADSILRGRAPGMPLTETIRNCGVIERVLRAAQE